MATSTTRRDWWEDVPREAWKPRKLAEPPKDVRDFLRWQEESWAMRECRSVLMRPQGVHR